MKKTIAFTFILLCFGLTQFCTTFYVPAMPGMVQVFSVTAAAVMRTLLVFFVGYMLGQLFWGMMSDYYGRKRMVILALLLYLTMAAGTGWASSLLSFNITYGVFGFSAAAFTSIGNAFIRDLFGKSGAPRAIAVVGLIMGSGPVIGPVIGAHLMHWFSWRAIFFCLAILAVIALLGVTCLVPETHHKAHRSGGRVWYQTYFRLFSHRRYVGYLLILGCQFGALYGFLDIAPFIIRHYLHTNLILSGYLLMIGSMGMLLGAITVLLCVKRIGINGLLKIGLGSAIGGGVLLAVCAFVHSQDTWLVIWPMALATYGFGICVPGCKAGAMTVFESNSGAASSMMKFMQIVLTNVVLLVIAHWHHANSLWPMAIMVVLLALFAIGIFYGLIATKMRV